MTDIEKKILDVLVQEYGIYEIAETINKMKCTTHDAIRTDKYVDYKSHEMTIGCSNSHYCSSCKHNGLFAENFPCTHCCEYGKCYWEAK